jgi:hypothetical protein
LQYKIQDIYALYQKATAPPHSINYNNVLYINHQNISTMPKISYNRFQKAIPITKAPFMQTSDALYSHTSRYIKPDIYTPNKFKLLAKKINSPLTNRTEISHYRVSAPNKENMMDNIKDEEIACEFKAHEISIAESLAARSKAIFPYAKDRTLSNSQSINCIKLRSMSNTSDTNQLNVGATPPLRISAKIDRQRLLETLSSAALIEKKNKVIIEEQILDSFK